MVSLGVLAQLAKSQTTHIDVNIYMVQQTKLCAGRFELRYGVG